MKKSTNNKELSTADINLKLNNILISQQKLWEIVFKLDKDILAGNEIIARLLFEYKAISVFEQQFIKTYKKEQGEAGNKPKFPFY